KREAPFPTFFIRPLHSNSLPWRILFQPKEGLCPRQASKKLQSGKYLLFITLEKVQSGKCKILQACLAKRAWLNNWISRKPSPPSVFGRHNLSQLNQCIFLLCSKELHQK
ncbi:unnamed protein product, partial [Arabidopsis halleri]